MLFRWSEKRKYGIGRNFETFRDPYNSTHHQLQITNATAAPPAMDSSTHSQSKVVGKRCMHHLITDSGANSADKINLFVHRNPIHFYDVR